MRMDECTNTHRFNRFTGRRGRQSAPGAPNRQCSLTKRGKCGWTNSPTPTDSTDSPGGAVGEVRQALQIVNVH
jgi:hypothetical protein